MAQRRIFISYSRKDQEFVEQLTADLIEAGAEIWLDLKDIIPGTNWGESIQEGLDSAEEMVLVLSPEAVASKNVALEWQYYFDNNKPIIPILLNPVKIPFQISRTQYVDFHKFGYDASLLRLKKRLGLVPDDTPTPVFLRKPNFPADVTPSQVPTTTNADPIATGVPAKPRIPRLPFRLPTRPQSGRKVAIVGAVSLVIIAALVVFILNRVQTGLRTTARPTSTVTRTPRLAAATSTPRRTATKTPFIIPSATKPKIVLPTSVTVRATSTLSGVTSSPITKLIYFLSTRGGTGSYELYSMYTNGSSLKQLTTYSQTTGRLSCPSWSVLTQQFVVGVTLDKTKKACTVCSVIHKLSLQTTSPITMTNSGVSSFPEWSPDGKKIAYICSNNLCTMDATTRSVKQYTNTTTVKSNVIWSTSGTTLYYTENSDIKKFDLSTLKSTTIVNGTGTIYAGDESPDGKQLAYVNYTTTTKGYAIYIAGTNGTGARKVAEGSSPEWSPDGRYILYSAGGKLSLLDTLTGGNTLITATGLDYCPVWGSR